MADRIPLDELEILSPKELGEILLDELRKDFINIQYIKDLLNAGASLGARYGNGWSALRFAAYRGRIDVIKALLNAGALIDAQDGYGWTTLHWAAKYGRVKIAKILIDANASLKVLNNEGKTPWNLAKTLSREVIPQLNPKHND